MRQGSSSGSGSEERGRDVVGPVAKWKSGHKEKRKNDQRQAQYKYVNQNKQSKNVVGFSTPSRTCESELRSWRLNRVPV